MTEAEWLKAREAQHLAVHLQERGLPRTKAGRRKLRLFGCGCCRAIWDLLPNNQLRKAVQTAERFADGLATKEDLSAVRNRVMRVYENSTRTHAPRNVQVATDMAVAVTNPSAYSTAFYMTAVQVELISPTAEARIQQLLRCVFGNPFRPVAIESVWRTRPVVSLSQAIYDERAFDRLPILADALEDAGCTEQAILEHCRGGTEHVRGCWVVDLLTGRQ